MKHNYISQGKNYISSKRASKISEYSSDYVGQLCRQGKLDCKRVGHNWFVTEESLRSHMTRVWSDDALRTRASNLQRRFINDQTSSKSDDALNDSTRRISSKQAALLSGYSADYIGQLCRSKKLDAVMIGKTWFVVEDSLKSHMEKIRAEENARKVEKQNQEHVVVQRAARANIADRTPAKSSVNKFNSRSFFAKLLTTTLVAIVLVAVGSTIFLGSVSVSNVAVKQPMVAGVYEAAQFVSEIFSRSFAVIAKLFSGQHDLAVNVDSVSGSVNASEIGSDNSGVADRGMVVVPMSDVKKQDEEMKAAIQRSFSDQVKVVPDKTGSSGVITPVFKKANGKDFMYVMVPLDSQQNSNQHPP